MIRGKKNSYYVISFVFAIVSFTYTMEPPRKKQKTIDALQIIDKPYVFSSLPKDINDNIVDILFINSCIANVFDSAKTVRSLSCVNFGSHEYANNSVVCLILIKKWTDKYPPFNNKDIAKILRIKQAKQHVELQEHMHQLLLSGRFIADAELLKAQFNDLCAQGADLEFTHEGGECALIVASRIDQPIFTTLILAKGVNINRANALGRTALMVAASCKNQGCIELLLKAPNIAINQQDEDGKTALVHNLYANSFFVLPKVNIVKLLLDAGANPKIESYSKKTVLQLARQSNSRPIIALIENALAKN